jgi:hypothetical protein
MAQTFVYNFNEQSPQGYLKPANTTSAVSPDNVTHAQLRYTDFSSSYVIQGSVVSGANSTFEFSIADNLASEIFKMYYSTDGTTYNVDKTFGGTSGKKLFATADLSGLVTTGTAQNITATKTLTTNANLVVSSGSDITVQSGGDITLADAPTASTDAVNKAYVDGLIGYTEYIAWVNQDGTNAPVSTVVKNNTGRTWTWSYISTGNYGLTPSGANPFSDFTKFDIEYDRFISSGQGQMVCMIEIDSTTAQTSGSLDVYVVSPLYVATPAGTLQYESVFTISGTGGTSNNAIARWLVKIRLYP